MFGYVVVGYCCIGWVDGGREGSNWCLRYVVVGYCCIGWGDGGREGSNWCLGMWLLDIVVLVG